MSALLTFLFFTGLVAFFSWRATRADDHQSSTGYFLAGRNLSWIVIAGSLLLTNLSTEQLVGLNGGAFSNGMQVMAWEVWSSIAIVLMALVFLPRYLKGGIATVSEFLTRRYSRTVGSVVSIMLLLSLVTNLLPFVLYSGAIFMREVFNVSGLFGDGPNAGNTALWATVIALGTVGAIYAIFGGLKAVAVSDTLNGIGLLIGGLLIPILGLIALGNQLGGGGGFSGGVSYLLENNPEKLNPVGAEDENIPFSTLFTGMLFIVTYYWCTNQAIVQRTFGSRSLAEGQKGVLFAAFMKLLGPLYLVLPGIIAWHLFGTISDGEQTREIAKVVTEDVAAVVQEEGSTSFSVVEKSDEITEALGLAKDADLSAIEGQTFDVGEGDSAKKVTVAHMLEKGKIVAHGNDGAPVVVDVKNHENYLDKGSNDNAYAKLVIQTLPTWMIGFFAAVIFGAILSSFNSGLNSAATLFSLDVYKGLINKEATDPQMVKVGKIFGISIAVAAILVAPMIQHAKGGLFDLMKNLAALYNIPLIAVVVLGMFHKRITSQAAIAAIIVGLVFYSWFGIMQKVPDRGDFRYFFGAELHWLHIAGINFVLLSLVMIIISAIRPRTEPYVQTYTKDVDITPWKGAVPAGVGILILIAVMYYLMSLFGA